MHTFIWEVKFLNPPEVIRHCKKCGEKTRYASSGSFRINAQQKSLDIWLIYRCVHCKNTWNAAVYSRINPKSISREQLEAFMKNDTDLAERYAMDIDFLSRNGAKVEIPPLCIVGSHVDLECPARIIIRSAYPIKIKVSKVLREKLPLSKKLFDRLADGGKLLLENGADIRRAYVQRETIVIAAGLTD